MPGGGMLGKMVAVEEKDLMLTAFTKMEDNMDRSITQEEFVSACFEKTGAAPHKQNSYRHSCLMY